MVKLEERLKNDLITALKGRQELRVSTLRFLLAEIYNYQTQKQKDLTDEEIIFIIRRQIKQRVEAIALYQKGGRNDLADKERNEQEILSKYLPQEISPQDLEKLIKETISEVGTAGKARLPDGQADFGRLMGAVMNKVKGKAGGEQVAKMVEKQLKEAQ